MENIKYLIIKTKFIFWLHNFVLLVQEWNLQPAKSLMKDFLTRCKTMAEKCSFHFHLHFLHKMYVSLQNKVLKGKYQRIQKWWSIKLFSRSCNSCRRLPQITWTIKEQELWLKAMVCSRRSVLTRATRRFKI